MDFESCLLVKRKVAIGGGTVAAISAMSFSEITPGPLGISETNPNADAPQRIASCASTTLLMQQILTRGFIRMKMAVCGIVGATKALRVSFQPASRQVETLVVLAIAEILSPVF